MKTSLRTAAIYFFTIIAVVLLMAEPTNERAKDYASKLRTSKAIAIISGVIAIGLSESKKEERDFLNRQEKIIK